MKTLFIFTLLMFLCYLGCAFITLESNPLEWGQTARICYICFGVLGSFLGTDLITHSPEANHRELMDKLKEEIDKLNVNEK